MILATASKYSLAMTEVKRELVRNISKFLNIGEVDTSTSERF